MKAKTKPKGGPITKEEIEMYDRVCRPHMEQLSADVGELKAKIFNGHSTSIKKIEAEVGEVKKLLIGMLIGITGGLAGIVLYMVFGISL